ncbi:MAG: hypothetical protein ACRELF_02440 [Gemmataceae bacterium]
MKVELLRIEIQRLLRQAPFRPFVLTLVGGERALIEHPENIAFDPRPGGASDFYVLSGSLRLYSNFKAVSSAAVLFGDENGSQEQAQD